MLRWLRDALFPLSCVGCGKERTLACDDCVAGVRFFEGDFAVPGLDRCVALFSYADPVVKGVLHQAKFCGVDATRQVFETLTARGIARYSALLPRGEDILVVPVPTTFRRIRERGFHQTYWIADAVSAFVRAPVVEALLAQDHTRQCHLLSDAERMKNIRGVFTALLGVKGKRVILVDDVVTSGATLSEAARVLRAAGALEVFGVALARGGKKKAV